MGLQFTTFVIAASFVYLLATIIYGAYAMHFREAWARNGLLVVAAGAVVHLVAIVLRVSSVGLELRVYDVILIGCGVAVLIFLLSQLKKQRPLLGVFVSPLATIALYSLHVFTREAGGHTMEPVNVVTPVHIGSSVLAFLIFTGGAVAAALLITQEYRLKTKKLSLATGSRLPSLSTLDKASHRSIILGFPIYTVGIALGGVWLAAHYDPHATRRYIMASFSWLLYAIVLHLRVSVGWKGRRAALLTLLAYVSALFVVLLYLLRLGG